MAGPTNRAQRKEGNQTTSRGFHDEDGEGASALVCKQRRQRENPTHLVSFSSSDDTRPCRRHPVSLTPRSHLSHGC